MKLRWGIIGAGMIARELADGVIGSETGVLQAVASRSQAKAEAFAKEYHIPVAHGSYEAMLADASVDAVYIATPHPMHKEWSIKAAKAKKHILCEKPSGINRAETVEMIEAAKANDVFWMEAFMYRCHPQMAMLRKLIAGGEIGDVQVIRASFAFDATPGGLVGRAFENDLAGGGILDVGCYPVSVSRLIAGAAHGKSFEEPEVVKGVAMLGPTGVDHYALATLRFPGGILAELSTGVGLNMHQDQTVKIFGSKGSLFLADPWCPSRWNRNPVPIVLRRHADNTETTILVDAPKDLYAYEADMVGDHIADRQSPAMSWDDTLGNMDVLDLWRAEIGLVYDREKTRR